MRIRAQIDELFASDRELGDILEDVARLGARLLLQTALEAEVTEFLGRDRYQRGERTRAGDRNGHTELTVKTTAGPVVLERPKLRGTSEAFASRLLGAGVVRSNALESLVIAGLVRGLSVRDVEQVLAGALGPEATLSKSTVSRICQQLKDEFAAWSARDLRDVELDYLYVDGSHFKMHPGARAEPALVAWASPPRVHRCCWAWPRPPARPMTPGMASWLAWSSAGSARRCWASATARRG